MEVGEALSRRSKIGVVTGQGVAGLGADHGGTEEIAAPDLDLELVAEVQRIRGWALDLDLEVGGPECFDSEAMAEGFSGAEQAVVLELEAILAGVAVFVGLNVDAEGPEGADLQLAGLDLHAPGRGDLVGAPTAGAPGLDPTFGSLGLAAYKAHEVDLFAGFVGLAVGEHERPDLVLGGCAEQTGDPAALEVAGVQGQEYGIVVALGQHDHAEVATLGHVGPDHAVAVGDPLPHAASTVLEHELDIGLCYGRTRVELGDQDLCLLPIEGHADPQVGDLDDLAQGVALLVAPPGVGLGAGHEVDEVVGPRE